MNVGQTSGSLPRNLGELWALCLGGELLASAETRHVLEAVRASDALDTKAPLTMLQKEFARVVSEGGLDTGRNLLLSAPTSTGKTTLAQILLVRSCLDLEGTRDLCAVYIAPTRALAHAFLRQLRELLAGTSLGERLVVSTSDFSDDDWRIERGDFAIASMVFEKAGLLFRHRKGVTAKLGCLVVDELHMLSDVHRGPGLELSLTKTRLLCEHPDARSFRVIGITTEPEVGPAMQRFLTSHTDSLFTESPPLFVNDHTRPVPVRHTLVLQALGPQPWRELVVHDFAAGHGGRRVDVEQLADVMRRAEALDPEIRKATDKLRGPDRAQAHRERVSRFVAYWHETHAQGRRALVACVSPTEAETLADLLLRQARARGLDQQTLPEPLFEVVRDRGDALLSERLKDLCRAGIFLHHAQVEKDVRHAVELCFQSPISADSPTQVILGTDTLAYGMNLALDTVVLTDTRFWAAQRRSPPSRIPMDPSRFHNLVGRAGRLGRLGHERADVFVLCPPVPARIHNGAPQSGGYFQEVVQRYYARETEIRSCLFVAKHDSVSEGVPAHEATRSVSFPWVHVVLDAVRFQSGRAGDGTAALEDVVELLDRSLHREADGLDDEAHRSAFLRSIGVVLQGSCHPEFGFLTEEGARYRLTPVAHGLLDSGTHHTSVPTLRALTAELSSLWARHGRGTAFPARLALLAALALEECTNQYLGATPDCRAEDAGHALYAQQKRFLAPLEERFSDMSAADPRTLRLHVQRTLESFFDHHLPFNLRNGDVPVTSANACWGVLRLWLALDAWTTGRSWERDVVPILSPSNGKRSGLVAKWANFTRFVSWKCLFLARFFEEQRIVDEGAGWFEQLSTRLIHGLPGPALGFRESETFQLRRWEALQLLEEGWPPDRMLSEQPESVRGLVSARRMPLLLKHLEARSVRSVQQASAVCMRHLPETLAGDAVLRVWRLVRQRGHAAGLAHAIRREPVAEDLQREVEHALQTSWDAVWTESGLEPERPAVHLYWPDQKAPFVLGRVGSAAPWEVRVHWPPPNALAQHGPRTNLTTLAFLLTALAGGMLGITGWSKLSKRVADRVVTPLLLRELLPDLEGPPPIWLDVALRAYFDGTPDAR